jgi:hypothetical protein
MIQLQGTISEKKSQLKERKEKKKKKDLVE